MCRNLEKHEKKQNTARNIEQWQNCRKHRNIINLFLNYLAKKIIIKIKDSEMKDKMKKTANQNL